MAHTKPRTSEQGDVAVGSSLPELNDDLMRKILSHLPSSLNICLVSKAFRGDRRVRTKTSCDGDLHWLWDEAGPEKLDRAASRQARAMIARGAAHRGCVEFLQQCVDHQDCPVLIIARIGARAGRQNVLEWAREHGHVVGKQEVVAAVEGGHLSLLKVTNGIYKCHICCLVRFSTGKFSHSRCIMYMYPFVTVDFLASSEQHSPNHSCFYDAVPE